MRFKVFVVVALAICFTLILAMMTGAVQSEERGPQAVSGSVSSGISYQGFLADNNGDPLQGSHQFKFQLYNAPNGGDLLWLKIYSNVQVVDGLVDLVLDVDAEAFNGQALWLAVTVDGDLLAPRQELLPVPYAMSVRPGAVVVGSSDNPVFSAHNNDHIGISGSTNGDTEWEDAGVFGYSHYNNTFGVLGESEWGIGLEGKIENPENGNPAVVGFNQGSGPGIYAYGRDDDSPDLVLGGDDDQDNGLLTSDLGHPSSDIILASNDAVVIALDDNDDEDGHFVVVNGQDEYTLVGDEYGNLEVMGDLTVYGNLHASGPTCVQFGPYTDPGLFLMNVPSFCIDQFCWIIVQGDGTIGAYSPGLYTPVLYMQNSNTDEWVGGPAISIAGMTNSHGGGINGDNYLEIIAPSGETSGGGRITVWDDSGEDSTPELWSFVFEPKAGELTTATLYACPMGNPQVP